MPPSDAPADASAPTNPRADAAAESARADRDLLISAARAAGPVALAKFRHGQTTTARRWKKPDDSIVTETDLAVNDVLREELLGARPDYGWLSEEEANAPPYATTRRQKQRVFLIDPIDGTRSFVDGKPEFCFSLAVAEDGKAIAAVIFVPALEALYDAAHGAPTRKNGAPVSTTGRAELDGARVLATKSCLRAENWRGAPPAVDRGWVHPIAYRLCLVAEGAWDAIVALRPTNEWDVAAGDLLVRCAGGRATDAAGAAYRYNKADPTVAGALAAGTDLHAALQTRLTPTAGAR